MSLSTEQKLAINMKVARDMGIAIMEDWVDSKYPEAIITDDIAMDLFNIFDPEKGDLNKAVQFYKIDVVFIIIDRMWESLSWEHHVAVKSEDRDLSMQKAVIAASGVAL